MQICVWRLVGNISFSQIAFVGEPFSLTTVTRFLRQEGGLGRFGPDLVVVFVWLLKVVWAPRAQATYMQLIGWDFGAYPINFHPLPSAEGRTLPSAALRVGSHRKRHRAR